MVTHEIVRGAIEIGRIPSGAGRKIMSGMLGLEVLYAFIIIVASLMIYFGTKELWQLSKHKGIHYFRQAFLFFAIAYFFRTFIKFILLTFNIGGILEFSPRLIGPISLFLFVYFSTMAMFYLLYSLVYKKWSSPAMIMLLQVIALIISVLSIATRNLTTLFVIHAAVLVFVSIAGYAAHQQTKKKKHSLYPIYVLLFLFWILNIVDIVVPNFLSTFQLFIYLASTGIFLAILYKALRRIGI